MVAGVDIAELVGMHDRLWKRVDELKGELAALKARRCDGCRWCEPGDDPSHICCTNTTLNFDVDINRLGRYDFSCKHWEAKG